MEPKVFLSYANTDLELADRLFSQLRGMQISLFFDRVTLRHGEHILSVMRSQIAAADFLVLLLSPAALESQWVQRDLEYAVSTELLCAAYEAFKAGFPSSSLTIEQALLVLTALARGDEVALRQCPQCSAPMLLDRLSTRHQRCPRCSSKLAPTDELRRSCTTA